MNRTREQSNILNGGAVIENYDPGVIPLTIDAADNQTAPVMVFKHGFGDFIPTEQITTDVDLYVSLAGDDVNGYGTMSQPWATIHRAMEWLYQKKITGDATITVHVGAGNFISDTPIQSFHPDGAKIEIIGADLSGNKPVGCQIADWLSSRSAPSVPTRGVDEFSNRAGTLGSDVGESTRDSDRVIDRSDNEVLLRTRYATILTFTGGSSGFEASNGGMIGKIDKMAIIGDYAEADITTGKNAVGIYAGAGGTPSMIQVGSDVAIHGFNNSGLRAEGKSVIICDIEDRTEEPYDAHKNLAGITITGCGYGILASDGGGITADGTTVCGHDIHGVGVLRSGNVRADNLTASGNKWGVRADNASSIKMDYSIVTGSDWDNVGAVQSSSIKSTDLIANGANRWGVVASYSASLLLIGPIIIGNNAQGATAHQGGNVLMERKNDVEISIKRPYLQNNGIGGVFAGDGASMVIQDPQIRFNSGYGISSYYGSTVRLETYLDAPVVEHNDTYQAIAAYHGNISMDGSLIRRTNNVQAVLATVGATITSSSLSSPSTYSSGVGNTAALVYAVNGSFIYDLGSNISAGPTNPVYYSPSGNTYANHDSYIRTS